MSVDENYDRNWDYGTEVNIRNNDGNFLVNGEVAGNYNPNCSNDDRYMGWMRQEAVQNYHNSRTSSSNSSSSGSSSYNDSDNSYSSYDTNSSGSSSEGPTIVGSLLIALAFTLFYCFIGCTFQIFSEDYIGYVFWISAIIIHIFRLAIHNR